LLGTYGGRSPCVRTLRPDQEAIVLEAAKDHNKNNEDNMKSKGYNDDKDSKYNREASFDPIPGEILQLSPRLSPYYLLYLSSWYLLLIFHHIIHHGSSLSFHIHMN
jgi:hypothetical protein